MTSPAASTRLLIFLYMGLLALNVVYLYLGLDGAQTMRLAEAEAQPAPIFARAYQERLGQHYASFPRLDAFSVVDFISVSYYTGLFVLAPAAFIGTALALALLLRSNGQRLLAVGFSLILVPLVLLQNATLNHIAHWLD